MRQIRLIVVFLLIIALFGCNIILPKESTLNEIYNKTKDEVINEGEKTLNISDKISENLKIILNKTDREILHVSLELESGFNETKLKQSGIIVHGYMGESLWSATIYVKNITKIVNLTEIKLIKEIPIDRKLREEVKNSTYHDFAKHPDEDVSVLVYFFPDVNNQSASDILAKYGGLREWIGPIHKYGPGPNNYYRVKISPDKAKSLAQEDEVKFITEIPGPKI